MNSILDTRPSKKIFPSPLYRFLTGIAPIDVSTVNFSIVMENHIGMTTK